MKKTLITLLALAGVALADYNGGQVDSWLTDVLQERGNSAYTLTFTLSDTFSFDGQWGVLLTLNSNNWVILHQEARYVGLGESGARPGDSYATRDSTSVNYIDMDEVSVTTVDPETNTETTTSSADYNGWIYDSGAHYTGLAGYTFSVYGSTGSSIISVTLPGENGRTMQFQRDGMIAPSGLNFGYDNQAIFKTASIEYDHATFIIPEPATATLSLLALAGLAARRRRK